MRMYLPAASFILCALAIAACETSVVPPGYGDPTGSGEVEVTPPEGQIGGTAVQNPDITVAGPECLSDDDCWDDEACLTAGGCDGDPCRDDRCSAGECIDTVIEGCDPGYQIEYRYRSCCDWRTLTIAPDGRCTFQIDGEPARRCDDVSPLYIQTLVDHAGTLGFFYWGMGHCVPGETQADFSLYLQGGDFDNEVSCDQGVCVGDLCNVLDGVWATLPSNWHDGCGCE